MACLGQIKHVRDRVHGRYRLILATVELGLSPPDAPLETLFLAIII